MDIKIYEEKVEKQWPKDKYPEIKKTTSGKHTNWHIGSIKVATLQSNKIGGHPDYAGDYMHAFFLADNDLKEVIEKTPKTIEEDVDKVADTSGAD